MPLHAATYELDGYTPVTRLYTQCNAVWEEAILQWSLASSRAEAFSFSASSVLSAGVKQPVDTYRWTFAV